MVQRSAARLRHDRPLDSLILLVSEYPRTLVRQVGLALRHADVEKRLDVWELQAPRV